MDPLLLTTSEIKRRERSHPSISGSGLTTLVTSFFSLAICFLVPLLLWPSGYGLTYTVPSIGGGCMHLHQEQSSPAIPGRMAPQLNDSLLYIQEVRAGAGGQAANPPMV